MRGRWLWLGAGLVYALFRLWYDGVSGPLSPAEIETYVEKLRAAGAVEEPERLAGMREFLRRDDGEEFFMLNLLRLHPGPVADPGDARPRPAREVLRVYTDGFLPALYARAGHFSFGGEAAGLYIERWGVEPDPGWSAAGVFRYRSRRDLMDLATDPEFESIHAYKLAALANTLALPVSPGAAIFGPRVWVALGLALLAALGHLALALRRGS
ncbi:MAG: hypothetical protein J4G09_16085 [Proteobacteria bacterium]|nr:hypothetical protein [Pseudomonadota bacterium]